MKYKNAKRVVLLVEDDKSWKVAARALEYIGNYLVVHYSSAQKAIEEIHRGLEYSVALVDRELRGRRNRGLSGDDVMECSQKFNLHSPVFCTSGYGDKPKHANIIIPKPWDIDFLISEIERITSVTDKIRFAEKEKRISAA